MSIPPPTVAINCRAQLNGTFGSRAETKTETGTETERDGETKSAGADSTALRGSGWIPIALVYADEPLLSRGSEASASGTPGSTLDGSDGVVSAQIPAGQLAHAALVWYGTLAATLFAASVVSIS